MTVKTHKNTRPAEIVPDMGTGRTTETPLHVELSRDAAAALASIRELKSWNKKTAVDAALCFYADAVRLPRPA